MSSSDIAVSIQGLSKAYAIVHQADKDRSLREAALRKLKNPRQSTRKETFWALKDVSFDVQEGDVVGIVGRNGAGKSTLLKILSRITEPNRGRIEIFGRIGSLLEVGTGFHPELTGRENIYLNGAILGMRKREIEQQFDAIVDFSGVEQFLDTPVKRYSSGMYVRLAFAVAAHLEAEILIVDEVLAVGDADFQKKCLGKMQDVATQSGRTVLFVSHNMGAVAQVCPKAILMRSGQIEIFDRTEVVIRNYLHSTESALPDVSLDFAAKAYAPVVFTRCWIADDTGAPLPSVDVTEGFNIAMTILVRAEVLNTDIGARIFNSMGQPLFTCNLSDVVNDTALHPGTHTFFVRVPGNVLAPDTYSLTVGVHRPAVEILDYHEHVLSFHVEETGSSMSNYYGLASATSYGNILVKFPWRRVSDMPASLEGMPEEKCRI